MRSLFYLALGTGLLTFAVRQVWHALTSRRQQDVYHILNVEHPPLPHSHREWLRDTHPDEYERMLRAHDMPLADTYSDDLDALLDAATLHEQRN